VCVSLCVCGVGCTRCDSLEMGVATGCFWGFGRCVTLQSETPWIPSHEKQSKEEEEGEEEAWSRRGRRGSFLRGMEDGGGGGATTLIFSP